MTAGSLEASFFSTMAAPVSLGDHDECSGLFAAHRNALHQSKDHHELGLRRPARSCGSQQRQFSRPRGPRFWEGWRLHRRCRGSSGRPPRNHGSHHRAV